MFLAKFMLQYKSVHLALHVKIKYVIESGSVCSLVKLRRREQNNNNNNNEKMGKIIQLNLKSDGLQVGMYIYITKYYKFNLCKD